MLPDDPPLLRARNHRELRAWQRAMALVAEIYALSRRFPVDERFGLTSQIRRAAVSIPANIAEGHARQGAREYRQFVSIARGSLAELETELAIAERLSYITQEDTAAANRYADEVGRMLSTLHARLTERG